MMTAVLRSSQGDRKSVSLPLLSLDHSAGIKLLPSSSAGLFSLAYLFNLLFYFLQTIYCFLALNKLEVKTQIY